MSLAPFLSGTGCEMGEGDKQVQVQTLPLKLKLITLEKVTSDAWLSGLATPSPLDQADLSPTRLYGRRPPLPLRDRPSPVVAAGAVDGTLAEDRPAWGQGGRG